MRATSANGEWTVDAITLECAGARDGQWLRIQQHGMFFAEVRTIDQLAAIVPLADLEIR